ncbi:hypothetical protein M422DRAFT_271131 [Sphaerobolus stellatus SS14]|uniref:Unplaced genomic scaffold SPHSTscaffold_253, whole genome shotgun sequence n=1 Tax=Sphaerobolus stellatus (strain SS14) TaxID=990650 RepID=A0A0C9TED4_SPHS4|nr:hypothetical protein M422DRAFT_271131 [Sphaerobolus stellatus SS14]
MPQGLDGMTRCREIELGGCTRVHEVNQTITPEPPGFKANIDRSPYELLVDGASMVGYRKVVSSIEKSSNALRRCVIRTFSNTGMSFRPPSVWSLLRSTYSSRARYVLQFCQSTDYGDFGEPMTLRPKGFHVRWNAYEEDCRTAARRAFLLSQYWGRVMRRMCWLSSRCLPVACVIIRDSFPLSCARAGMEGLDVERLSLLVAYAVHEVNKAIMLEPGGFSANIGWGFLCKTIVVGYRDSEPQAIERRLTIRRWYKLVINHKHKHHPEPKCYVETLLSF